MRTNPFSDLRYLDDLLTLLSARYATFMKLFIVSGLYKDPSASLFEVRSNSFFSGSKSQVNTSMIGFFPAALHVKLVNKKCNRTHKPGFLGMTEVVAGFMW